MNTQMKPQKLVSLLALSALVGCAHGAGQPAASATSSLPKELSWLPAGTVSLQAFPSGKSAFDRKIEQALTRLGPKAACLKDVRHKTKRFYLIEAASTLPTYVFSSKASPVELVTCFLAVAKAAGGRGLRVEKEQNHSVLVTPRFRLYLMKAHGRIAVGPVLSTVQAAVSP
ncbi:MAG: hypothetical protein JRH20_26160, partial [Deltaproteobacteria bacterium]|nr:hypothetical protein [Deltaproteobacteria bacterium]